jgi:hypothetical protein
MTSRTLFVFFLLVILLSATIARLKVPSQCELNERVVHEWLFFVRADSAYGLVERSAANPTGVTDRTTTLSLGRHFMHLNMSWSFLCGLVGMTVLLFLLLVRDKRRRSQNENGEQSDRAPEQ